MRAVALADKAVQQNVAKSFIPLKLVITPRSPAFPLDWPAMAGWRFAYKLGEGDGFTGCSVVSPDLQLEYGNTGSAFIWEMFDSTAYDAQKFNAMLDRAAKRAAREREIRADKTLSGPELERQLASFRDEVRQALPKEGPFRLPPKGFTIQGAIDLFTLSGDYPPKAK